MATPVSQLASPGPKLILLGFTCPYVVQDMAM